MPGHDRGKEWKSLRLQQVEGGFRGTGWHSTLASELRQAGGEKVGSTSPTVLRNSLSNSTGHCLILSECLAGYLKAAMCVGGSAAPSWPPHPTMEWPVPAAEPNMSSSRTPVWSPVWVCPAPSPHIGHFMGCCSHLTPCWPCSPTWGGQE